MEIRSAEETDLVSLVDLFTDAIEVQGQEYYAPDQVRAWADRATDSSFKDYVLSPTTFVAIDDFNDDGLAGIPMGFSGYSMDGHITSLYVRPDCAGQGVGKALLTYVLDHARDNGVTKFHVEASTMAIPLFEKFGFKKSGFDEITVGTAKFKRQLMTLDTGPNGES